MLCIRHELLETHRPEEKWQRKIYRLPPRKDQCNSFHIRQKQTLGRKYGMQVNLIYVGKRNIDNEEISIVNIYTPNKVAIYVYQVITEAAERKKKMNNYSQKICRILFQQSIYFFQIQNSYKSNLYGMGIYRHIDEWSRFQILTFAFMAN